MDSSHLLEIFSCGQNLATSIMLEGIAWALKSRGTTFTCLTLLDAGPLPGSSRAIYDTQEVAIDGHPGAKQSL